MAHVTGLDVVATMETPQKKIRMILQLNPLKSCFTVSIQTAFECNMQDSIPTEVQKFFSKNAFSLLPQDQIINNNNKCSLRRKSHTPIYSFLCFTLKEALIFLYISQHPAHFRAGVLTFSLWTLGILILSSVTISRRNKAFTQILQIRLNCSSDVTL